jgi:hypothetical protein
VIRRVLLIGLLLVGGGIATASDNVAPETSPDATPTPDIPPDSDPGVILKEFPPGGPVNQVRLVNKKDGGFLARSAVSLHRTSTGKVQPKNIAVAEGQCTDCVTMAIALQVFIYQRGAPDIQPQNIALAVNNACTRCVTIARAIQYVIPVDDPSAVPSDVRELLKDMENELRYFAQVKTVSELDANEANARLTRFTEQYAQLHQYLVDLTDKKTDAAPLGAPSGSPSASPSASPTATETPASPTAAPAPSESPSPSPAPTTTP